MRMQRSARFFAALFTILSLLSAGREARALEDPSFTVETLPGDWRAALPEIWGVGDSIKIVAPLLLPDSCGQVAAEVHFWRNTREISVILKPKGTDLPAEKICAPQHASVIAAVTIHHMPFIPGCHHVVTLEIPGGKTRDTVALNW